MNGSEGYMEQALNLHRNAIVIDAHSDIPINIVQRSLRGEENVLEHYHIPELIQGGVTGGPVTVWSDSGSIAPFHNTSFATMMTLRSIERMQSEIDENDNVLRAETVTEIRKAKRKGKIAFLYHLEGGKPLVDSIDYLKLFYKLGVRSIGLTWSNRNLIADGAMERSHSGISDFGVQVIQEMNDLGMVIDVSHLSDRGFWDVLEISKDPVIASHSNCRSLCDHARNLTDEQIEALAKKGGVIGVNFYPEFVHRDEPNLERAVDHIDHIRQLVGCNHIGIGADFLHYLIDAVGASHRCTERMENAAKLPNLTCALMTRGYTDDEIKKILGENFLRVFQIMIGE